MHYISNSINGSFVHSQELLLPPDCLVEPTSQTTKSMQFTKFVYKKRPRYFQK